ncbi:MAG: hypothetical protein ABIO61_02450 [Thermomonas sp.]
MAEQSLLQRFQRAGPLTWLLAACTGWALLLWLAGLLGMGHAVPPTPVITLDGALPQPGPPIRDRIGPLGQYAEAASRPVFASDRRPHAFMATSPDGEDGAGEQAQALDFILTGVLISPQVRLAILQPSGGGESIRVREGMSPEGASGWRLVDVQPRRAIFEGSNGESSLDLRVFGDAAPPIATAVVRTSDAPGTTATDGSSQDAADGAGAASTPPDQTTRIEEIRRRIEARRAQLRGDASTNPVSPPGAPAKQ